LTGESYPAEKHVRDEGVDSPGVANAKNAAFMGSSVMNGSARLLLFGTGLTTQLGQIAACAMPHCLEGEWPYIWLHATYVKARREGRVVSPGC